mgnify:CR=1 FL=1
MPEALSARGRRTQFLGILIVGGLILVALVSAVLWLSVAAGTAAIFFCMGVSFFALLAVYAGKLIVDEERYMQARLEARDARYRQTLELLPEGVVILKGEDGVIEWVNTMAGVHLGITSEDVGSVFTDRLIASQPAFCAWLRSRDFSRHYALETAGGSVLLDAAVVAPDERHTIIVTHDVTERRRVDDMRRDFVANVSHELRTPLTVIAGFLDLADMDVPPELRKRHLALMRDQTARMKRLTDDLLMLSKLENRDERGTDQPELIDMSALIDDAVREGMAYSKMQHKFEVAHEPLSLLGHPEEIRSAVLNLITNAVRYTPRGGRIRVVWKRTGTGAVLTVADTGQPDRRRTLLPRRQGALEGHGRHGPRSGHRQARHAACGRRALHRVDSGRRLEVHAQVPRGEDLLGPLSVERTRHPAIGARSGAPLLARWAKIRRSNSPKSAGFPCTFLSPTMTATARPAFRRSRRPCAVSAA